MSLIVSEYFLSQIAGNEVEDAGREQDVEFALQTYADSCQLEKRRSGRSLPQQGVPSSATPAADESKAVTLYPFMREENRVPAFSTTNIEK